MGPANATLSNEWGRANQTRRCKYLNNTKNPAHESGLLRTWESMKEIDGD
jgi:hypothetical protein